MHHGTLIVAITRDRAYIPLILESLAVIVDLVEEEMVKYP